MDETRSSYETRPRLTCVDNLNWLLDSDPSILRQLLRDLMHAPAEVVVAERELVATEGRGARLLAGQRADGL